MTSQLIRLAQHQHGVVATWQLHDLGLTSVQILRLSTHHGWERVTNHVLRREGSLAGAEQRAAAAVLDAGPGAVLSHRSAAAWWGHGGSRLERPVSVTTARKSSRGAHLAWVHRVRRIDERWVTDRRGINVARPELVAMQVFATEPYERAERLAETMWSQRLLTGRSIGLFLSDMGARGRNGIAGLRRFHEERGDDYTPSDSSLESRVQQLMIEACIPVRRQVDVGDDRAWCGRVDFLHAIEPLVIEVQSELHHTSLTDRASDAVRIGRLRDAGFVVVEVTDEMVWTDPAAVVRKVREGLGRLVHPSTFRSPPPAPVSVPPRLHRVQPRGHRTA